MVENKTKSVAQYANPLTIMLMKSLILYDYKNSYSLIYHLDYSHLFDDSFFLFVGLLKAARPFEKERMSSY